MRISSKKMHDAISLSESSFSPFTTKISKLFSKTDYATNMCPATSFSRDEDAINHSKYSCAKSEIKGTIILIRAKLFHGGGLSRLQPSNFLPPTYYLYLARRHASRFCIRRVFSVALVTGWRTTGTVRCVRADNRAWPG